MKTSRLSLLLLALFCGAAFSATPPAPSPERITSFDVDLAVNPDASVTVVERIQVAVEGKQIRKGIVRIIPIDHRTADGGVYRTEITLLSATLDGRPVPSAIQRSGGNISFVLGDVNVLLTHGIHTYEIKYAASGHVRFLEDRDAIYYNVTGNYWELTIDEASFRVHLPESARIVATNAYTGKLGESGADFAKDGELYFRTTRPLAVGEGLTAAVDWSKGAVQPPPPPRAVAAPKPAPPKSPSEWDLWVDENRDLSLLGFVAVALGYFVPAWLAFGPRRRRDTVIPLFYPPERLDPGAVATLRHGEAVPQCFGADVMQLAVKGHVRISTFITGFGLVETEPPPEKAKEGELSAGLARLKGNLFCAGTQNDAGETTVNTGSDQRIVAQAYNHLRKRYTEYAEGMFDKNRGVAVAGLALFAMYAVAVLSARMSVATGELAAALEDASLAFTLVLGGGGYVGFYMFLRMGGWGRGDRATILLAVAIVAFVVGVGMLAKCVEGEYIAAFLFGAAVIAIFSFWLLPRRTRECDRLMTEIDGLEMYIRTAEKDRLALINAPEDTVERYERLLPYAIALDCAEAWENRFAEVLVRAGYRPAWSEGETLGGRVFYPRGLGSAGEAASRATAEAIRQADIASRKASKSDGGWWSGGSGSSGGRSGGGSGGGGGGGW